jgi:hypothetical protein
MKVQSSSVAPLLVLLQEAFELVLPFVEDPENLLACSLTSTYHQTLVKLHVRQHLQQLLAQAHSAISRGKQSLLCTGKLKLLCSSAGSDVIDAAPVMQQLVKLLAECGIRTLQQAVQVLVKAGAHTSCCS